MTMSYGENTSDGSAEEAYKTAQSIAATYTARGFKVAMGTMVPLFPSHNTPYQRNQRKIFEALKNGKRLYLWLRVKRIYYKIAMRFRKWWFFERHRKALNAAIQAGSSRDFDALCDISAGDITLNLPYTNDVVHPTVRK